MALTLIVLNGPGKGEVFHLTGEEPEVIGRQAPRLRLNDPETSRRHSEIRYENDTWIIRDLGSTNGTYVNGRKLTGLTELEEGDQILVGRVLLVVGELATAGAPATPAAPPSAATAPDDSHADLDDAVGMAASAPAEEEQRDEPAAPPAARPASPLDVEEVEEPHVDSAAVSDLAASWGRAETPEEEAADREGDALTDLAAAAEGGEREERGAFDYDAIAAIHPADDDDDLFDSEEGEQEAAPAVSAAAPVAPLPPDLEESDDADVDGHINVSAEPESAAGDFGEDDLAAQGVAEDSGDTDEEPVAEAAEGDDWGALSNLEDEDLSELESQQAAPNAPAPPRREAREQRPEWEDDEDPLAELRAINLGEQKLDEYWPDLELNDGPKKEEATPEAPVASATPEFDVSDLELTSPSDALSDELDDEEADRAARASLLGDNDEVEELTLDQLLEDEASQAVLRDGPEAVEEEPRAADEHAPEPVADALLSAEAVEHDEPGDDQPSTGLLHHVGLAEETTEEQDESHANDESQIVHASLDEDEEDPAPPDTSLAQRIASLNAASDDDEADFLDDPDDARQAEAGVNLANLAPPVEGDEPPTSIIDEAVETHRPYESRDPFDGSHRRPGVPQEVSNPAQWRAPQRQRQIDEQRDAEEAAARAAAAEAARQAQSAQRDSDGSGRRRIVTLLTLAAIGGGAAGVWYAADQGLIDLPLPTGGETQTDGSPSVAGTEGWEAGPLTTEPAPQPQSPPPASVARVELPPPPPSITIAPPGETPPATALGDAPGLIGSDVLAGRLLAPTADLPAPVEPAPAPVETPPTEPAESVEAPTSPMPTPPAVARTDSAPAAPAIDGVVSAAPPAVDEPEEPAVAAIDRRVAYLVDASGSLLDTLPDVVAWLGNSIGELPRTTGFTVIFFRSGEAVEVPPQGIRAATRANKREAQDWMRPSAGNITAAGRSDMLPALRQALSYGVDEVVILSDNSVSRRVTNEGADEVFDQIAQAVGDRDVTIHTVQFFYDDPQNVLRSLAERYRGTFRFVKLDETAGPDPIEAMQNLSAAPLPRPANP